MGLLVILFLPFIGVMIHMIVRSDLLAPSTPLRTRDADEAALEGHLHLRG